MFQMRDHRRMGPAVRPRGGECGGFDALRIALWVEARHRRDVGVRPARLVAGERHPVGGEQVCLYRIVHGPVVGNAGTRSAGPVLPEAS